MDSLGRRSVTPTRARSLGPIPPARDPMEDTDPSVTRKRPRLDSGDRSYRSMSADRLNSAPHGNHGQHSLAALSPASAKAPSPEAAAMPPSSATLTPSKVTINVRDPSTAAVAATPLSSPSKDASTTTEAPPESVPNSQDNAETSTLLSIGSSGMHSPEIEVAEIEDMDGGPTETRWRTLGGADILNAKRRQEELLFSFPYWKKTNNIVATVDDIARHLEKDDLSVSTAFEQLASWMQTYFEKTESLSPHWWEMYLDRRDFWDEFPFLIRCLVSRNNLKYGTIKSARSSASPIHLHNFLVAFTALVLRMLRIDEQTLQDFAEEVDTTPDLISEAWIFNLSTLLTYNAPFWKSTVDFAHFDRFHTIMAMTRRFVSSPFDGINCLTRLSEMQALQASQPFFVRTWYSSLLVFTIFDTYRQQWDEEGRKSLSATLPTQGYEYFLDVDAKVQTWITKQVPALTIEGCQALVHRLDRILASVVFSDETIALRVLEAAVPSTPDIPAEMRASLSILSWKLSLLKKCIMEGRMEIRVYGVDCMQTCLVEAYSSYVQSQAGDISHPVAQYLSDWLLTNRMVEYFVGAESHPQLITRASNIIGFLVVTSRYSDAETDVIWNAITSSQDSSKTEAILHMGRGFCSISPYHTLHYLTSKMNQLPLTGFDASMIGYGKYLLENLREKWRTVASSHEPPMILYHLSIRLIRESTADKTLAPQKCLPIKNWAQTELGAMLQYDSIDRDLGSIYEDCLRDIANHTEFATGSVLAINTMFTHRPKDIKYLAQQANMTELLVRDIAYIAKSESSLNMPSQTLLDSLGVRFVLLETLLSNAPESVSPELARELWDVIVGHQSLENEQARANAWVHLRNMLRATVSRNSFIMRCIDEFLPELPPSCFVRDCIAFARDVNAYRLRFVERQSHEQREEYSGRTSEELLWRISLATPQDKPSIANTSISAFIALYLDSPEAHGRSRAANDAVHIELVERCIRQLTLAASKLRSFSDGTSSGEDEPMVIVASEAEIEAQKLSFARSLRILQEFVLGIRARPMYSPEPQTQPLLPKNFRDIKGDPVRILYQSFSGSKGGTEIRTVEVGDLETTEELATRLKILTGFSHLTVIAGGQKLDFTAMADQTVGKLGLHQKGLLLVRKAESPDTITDLAPTSGLRPVEVEILSHFSELYELLGLEESLAKQIYAFLIAFPPHPTITSRVCSPATPLEEFFPSSTPYKILYSTFALRGCLSHQLDKGVATKSLMEHSIHVLSATITTLSLDQSIMSVEVENTIAASLTECLLAFMKEPAAFNEAEIPFLNHRALVDRLQAWIERALPMTNISFEARKLVGESIAALLEASMNSPAFRKSFVEANGLGPLLRRLLLVESISKSREAVAKTIQGVCANTTKASAAPHDLVIYLWDSLVGVIPECLYFDRTSEQFFDVANTVFQTIDPGRREHLDLDRYMQEWCNLLLQHTHYEFVGRDEIDHVVLGLARLILYCFQIAKSRNEPLQTPEDFMELLFRKHLFPDFSSPTDDLANESQVPNLHTGVRTELLSIVSVLSNDKTAYQKLLALIRDLIPPPSRQQEDNQAWSYGIAQVADNYSWEPNWNFERAKAIRAPAGHPGLRNLSNTCYMNSLLTQLFMNVKFREFILNTHVTDFRGAQKLLQETRKLFAHMQETFLKSVDTHCIADSLMTYENTLIDVSVQMDVDEFYNLLFDRWESQILDDEEKKQFRKFYGGQIVQQIKSRECPHISERSEPFSAIQCDINGKTTLMESLEAYVTGEIMEGDNKYSCTSCGCYVEAVKRACLKDIPDNLIFHLKRFDFDLITGQRSKVNTRFEFPREIDMALYHVDTIMNPHRDASPDVFELVGVLIHTGTAESGHYYSYIKERSQSDSNLNTWVEFNDIDVGHFDPATIDDQCFGGWLEPTMYQTSVPKGYNAYMLFYERMSTDAPFVAPATASASRTPMKCKIPAELKNEVDYGNVFFLRQYCLFDPAYANFARNTLDQLRTVNKGICTDEHAMERESISLALGYLDRYHARTKDCPSIEQMISTLTRAVGSCSQCCSLGLEWVIQNPDSLKNLLLRCPYMKVRRDFAAMIAIGLRYLRSTEPHCYGFEETDEIESDILDTVLQVSNAKTFQGIASRLADLFNVLPQYARGWDDYFGLLAEMAKFGKPETHLLLRGFPRSRDDSRCGFLQKCLELLVCDSPLAQKPHRLGDDYSQYCRLVEKGRKYPMGKLIELVADLLDRVDLAREPFAGMCWQRSYDHDRMALTSDEDSLVKFGTNYPQRKGDSCTFVDKILTSGSNPQATHRIIRALLLAEPALSLHFPLLNTIKAGISVDPAVLAAPYLRAALQFCEYIPSRREAEILVKFVASEVDSIARSGGKEHLQFFADARRLRSARTDRPPANFNRMVLRSAPVWAPHLLSFCDENVRQGTLDVLKTLIFNHEHEDIDDEEEAEMIVLTARELCLSLAQKCDVEIKRGETLENPKAWESVTMVIKHCLKNYSDESFEPNIKPISDILDTMEALSVSDAEDPPSDTWNNSDGEVPSDSESDQFGASP